MTEAEWDTWPLPKHMVKGLPATASERKLRLVGCAACRRIVRLMNDARCRKTVEASEQFADKIISERELSSRSVLAKEAYNDARSRTDYGAMYLAAAASYASSLSLSRDQLLRATNALLPEGSDGYRREQCAQADLLRDIFGNPFWPVEFDQEWRTSTAIAIAQQMYESRDFSAMPILADALQDVGCDNDDILNHCRDANGVHVRGCWVVDLVLGKG